MIADLLSEAVPDLIQIFNLQECHGTPFLDPFFVESMIMQWKDRLNILPSTFFWCNTGSTFFDWAGDQMVYDTQTLCFCQVVAG